MGEMENNNSQNLQNGETSDQAGGNSTTGNNDSNSTEGSTKATEEKQERVFTQEEVNRMMAKEKHQGKNSVYNELGIDPKDTDKIQMFKAFIEAQKTDEDKKAEKDAKVNKEMSEMAQKLRSSELKASLMQAGVISEYVDDAVVIALSRMDADETLSVEDVAKDLKSKYSVWFEETQENEQENNNVGSRGTGKPANSGNSNSNNGSKISGIGKRLAESRKSNLPKESFWKDK